MSKKKIYAAVVGGGFIGKQHIEAIRRIPNAEVKAIVEFKMEKAKEIADTYHIEMYTDNIEDVFACSDIDVIHICTPNSLHYDIAKQALEHNIHVFCEKPLAISSEQSAHLVALTRQTVAKHAVNLNYRSNVMVREMREQILQGNIGDILWVQASYLQDWLLYREDYDWHFDPLKVGVSRAIADIGSHVFDLVQFVCDQKITAVFANLMTVYPTRLKSSKERETFAVNVGDAYEEVVVENEDAGLIIAQLENGQKVSIVISQVSGGYKNDLEIMVSGSKKSIAWKQESADRLYIGNRDTGNEMLYADAKYVSDKVKRFISLPNGHAVGWADAFKNSIQEFYLGIEGSEDVSYVDFEKGDYLVRLVEACVASDKTQTWVHL